ncbi:DUF4143 domain-containing protein, partial [bacterium]|nr:DUF4143 domain-containing protein [bacterium]
FNNFLINEFFKLADALEKHWKFSYFRTKDGVEIDLVIEKPRGVLILVEIKSWSRFPGAEKVQSYHRLAKELPKAKKYVLSNDLIGREIEGVRYLHWREGLKEIFDF